MSRPGAFQKGQSGNPGGRPKQDPEFLKAAREASEEALQVLIAVMRDSEHPQQVRAAELILDRAWGKPTQQVQGTHDGEIILSWRSRSPTPPGTS